MNDNVIAFGCSFTFGDELDDLPNWYEDMEDERNFMPQKLKYHQPSKKSYPYILGNLLSCKVENYGWRGGSNDRIFRTFFDHILNNKKKSIYVIQWTFSHRTEIWSNKGGFYSGITLNLIEEDKNAKEYYEEYYDENDVKRRLVRYMWSVDAICKEFNQKLYQFHPIADEQIENELPKSVLDTKKILELVDGKIHPTEQGHKNLAKYIRSLI